jgi:hypothetical protein
MLLSRHTRRREVIAGLGAAAAWPVDLCAQPARKISRIGMLETTDAALNRANLDAFRAGLRALGYVEARTLRSSTGPPTAVPNASPRMPPSSSRPRSTSS